MEHKFSNRNRGIITTFLETKPKHKDNFIFTIRDVLIVGIDNRELTDETKRMRIALVTWMGKRLIKNPLQLDGWTVTVWSRTNPYKYQAVRTHGT